MSHAVAVFYYSKHILRNINMKKKKTIISKRTIRKYILFLSIIIISVFLSKFLSSTIMNFDGLKRILKPSKSVLIKLKDKPETKEVIDIVRNSFELYHKKCSSFDEISTDGIECIDRHGIVLTAVESLETLYLLNQKDLYQKARTTVLEELKISKIGWVNRHELWTRVVGSLIGTFLLTKDNELLTRASEIADSLISLSGRNNKFANFVNLKKMQAKKSSWQIGLSLSDYFSGIPELIALFKLTQNPKYQSHLNQVLRLVPKIKGQLSTFYGTNLESLGVENRYDSFLSSFLANILIADKMTSNEQIRKIIDTVSSSIKNLEFSRIHMTHYMFYGLKLLNYKNDSIGYRDFFTRQQKRFESDSLGGTLPQGDRLISGFNFDSMVLREQFINDDSIDILSRILHITKLIKHNNGWSSVMRTISNKAILSGIQNSEFLSQWMKLAAETLQHDKSIFATAIVNERGHYLQFEK